MNTDNKYKALIHELEGICDTVSIWPAAIRGCGPDKDYEERDGYKNGWNAAVSDLTDKIAKSLDRAKEGLDADSALLLASEYVIKHGDKLLLIQSDTWGWAYCHTRVIKKEQIAEAADLFRRWGSAGLLYWETQQPDGIQKSEFKDINRFIAFVKQEEDFRKSEPSDSKRAYMDLPEKLS
jgi:hypothetical protein